MEVKTKTKNRKSLWCSKSAELPLHSFRLPRWNVDILLRNDIGEIDDEWDALVPDEVFAQSNYLKTLELTNPEHLRNLYVLIRSGEETVGVVLLQCLILRFGKSFNYDNYTTDRSFWSRLWQRIRQVSISWITFRMLTVGNLYLTGQYGINFKDDTFPREEQFKMIKAMLKILRKELCNTSYRFTGILYKDFFEKDAPQDCTSLGLNAFNIDPNMILRIRPSWMTFDDYLLDMKSKYRVRLKNALKKFKGIERRVIDTETLDRLWPGMYELYKMILDGSGFVLAMGKERYFLELKNQLQNNLHIEGYFLADELVGFYTWVLDHGKMDSHFIGFDPALNNRYQIYLNILLDLVKDAITHKATSVYYFRTALEIKSSVGAEPHDMLCYFRHSNGFINRVVIPIAFKYFVPQQTWKQRHPFK